MDVLKVVKTIILEQSELNLKFCGENYLIDGKAEKTGKPIVFGHALLSELAEFLESRNWKHWKKGNDIDKRNSITELIDLLHFLASLHIEKKNSVYQRKFYSFSRINIATREIENLDSFAEQVEFYHDTMMRVAFSAKPTEDMKFKILLSTLSKLYSMVMNFDLKYDDLCNITVAEEAEVALDSEGGVEDIHNLQTWIALGFARVLFYLNVSLEVSPRDALSLYLVKNVLNAFRMKHGYEKGTYVKIWKKSAEDEGMEDNDYIYSLIKDTNILDGNNADVKDNLLKLMDEEYSKIYKGEK